jgi:hypothetical protein
MTKPTDREALAILATFAHAVIADARLETVKLVDAANEALQRVGLRDQDDVTALIEEPAREVEMLTALERQRIYVESIKAKNFETELMKQIERACAAKWGLSIKETK